MLLKINGGHMIMGKSVLGDCESLKSRGNSFYFCIHRTRHSIGLKLESEREREREWICLDVQTLPSVLCWSQSCLVLLLPLSFCTGWQFVRTWRTVSHRFWIGFGDSSYFLKLRRRKIGACIKEEFEAVDTLVILGNLRTGYQVHKERGWTGATSGHLSVLERPWGDNPKTAYWDEPR